ncbi:MAG: cytochrome c [Novosphingobium sp.]|nr:cytochrome c [Novosphingobium sp.]
MRTALILAAATLSFAAAAVAHGADTPAADPQAGVIQARQAGFKLQLASFLAIKIGLTRGDDAKMMVLPASAIAGWGKAIPTMFPAGSNGAASNALPTVWSDRAGFEAAAANLTAAASKLADLAKAGDGPGATAQWEVLKGACNDCHNKYRKPDEKR